MTRTRVSVVGASGYSGGELVRLLLRHPHVELVALTSERHAGKPLSALHPNLRGYSDMKFTSAQLLEPVDTLFLCLPHGQAVQRLDEFTHLAPKIIDLSADFRLNSSELFRRWYGSDHPCPQRLNDFVYGVPELYREAILRASLVTGAGCNATAIILGLYPLARAGLITDQPVIAEVKVGSSEAGAQVNDGSHHPARAGCVRSFQPTGHRHTAEIEMVLEPFGPVQVDMSATAIDMVRGVLATCHVYPRSQVSWREVIAIFRETYANDPCIRLITQRRGMYRVPEPKFLAGSNHCDIAIEVDDRSGRIVVMSAIDNLMKGASGQAVQCFNLMHGFAETCALDFPGLSPV